MNSTKAMKHSVYKADFTIKSSAEKTVIKTP